MSGNFKREFHPRQVFFKRDSSGGITTVGMERVQVFLERLRKAHQESGLQQKELAHLSKVSASKVNRLLGGKGDPRLSEAMSLSAALKLPFAKLADPDGEVPPSPLTPFDRNPAYQRMVGVLEELNPGDRRKLLEFIEWFADTLQENGRERRPSIPPPADNARQDDQRIDLDGHKTR